MVVDALLDETGVDRVFQALADGTRRDIVLRTLGRECSVSALARSYPMSFAAVQKHVVVLEQAGLVSKRRHGREQLVRGEAETLHKAARLLDHLASVWEGRVARMDQLLSETSRKAEP